MKNIDDNSIDLIITSPPYDSIRDYKKGEWILDLPNIGKQLYRITKNGGIVIMVIQDQTKNFAKSLTSFKTIIDWCNSGFKLFECCIYNRNGKPGAWWNKRFRVDHEYIPIFFKGDKPQYFNKEHMKIDCLVKERKWSGNVRKSNGEFSEVQTKVLNNTKCPGTILYYKSSADEKIDKEDRKLKLQHPATFPDKLTNDFIQCFSTEGMTVLDPMCGSGTTCRMAKLLNRNYIGIDISQEYCDITNKRIKNII